MTLIPKISRLKKLPELLRQKKNAEEQSKKDEKEDQNKRPSFEIDDEVSINPEALSGLKIHHPLTPQRKARSDDDDKIGNNIDLTV
ncbi:MAG: hypothetical protein WD357_11290 [Gracilimonas sp.]